ncbi:MAG: hypothetical protein M9916_10215 [Crocinitomicaceae bacterium]|nr:hypothetical protein [Crocinitomicaceae bacterium]
MATNKKVTRVGGDESTSQSTSNRPDFVPTKEAKGRATQLRLIAGVLWALAIGAQVFAITQLFKQPVVMWLIITLIVVDLALVIVGSMLWKKSNRLDPASEKDKFLFFMQSQLGLFAAIVAFLPLVIFILTNKNIDKKQKAILGSIAGAALVIAGITGYDFNPPSVEEYTQQTQEVEDLNQGQNLVYWTKSGTKYHLSDSCSYINTDRTDEIFSGTLAQARESKKITELCNLCKSRAEKANAAIPEAAEEIVEANE